MNGDGLKDIVLVHDGRVDWWPNLGHGAWGRRVVMTGAPRLPAGHDPRRVLVGDVDGDGCDDLLYVADQAVTVWVNRAGNGFSDPITVRGTPSISDLDAVRLADMLGHGTNGVLWSSDASTASRGRGMFFLDLTGATKPYLLAEMDNHMGAMTRVEHIASTLMAIDDRAARRPPPRHAPVSSPGRPSRRSPRRDLGWQATTEYRYRHPYWNGEEREFCGFGRVDQPRQRDVR